jgi:multidrug efflux pump subunit AcrA (membrane-fusion protein)
MVYAETLKSIGAALKRRLPLLIVLTALLTSGALIASRPAEVQTEPPERAWVVETAVINNSSRQPNVELFGKIQSPQDTQLRGGVEAEVLSLLVSEGDTVTKGQLLILLDNRDSILELREREAELAEIRAQIRLSSMRLKSNQLVLAKEQELLEINESQSNRASELQAEGLLSKSDLDTSMESLKRQQLNINQSILAVEESKISAIQIEAQLMRASAQRDQAQLAFERTKIRAPFDGMLSDFNVSVGDRIGRGDNLMRLQNPATTEVRTQIPTVYAAALRDGLAQGIPMTVMVNSKGSMVPAKLLRVAGQTRQNSGGVDAFIGFENGSAVANDLRLGSTVRVLIELPPVEDVFMVPAEAVYGQNRIYTAQQSRMKSVIVERAGERVDANGRNQVLLRSPDVTDGTAVILTKLSNAADGLLIESSSNVRPADYQPIAAANSATAEEPVKQPDQRAGNR